jgi:hypothetical protein
VVSDTATVETCGALKNIVACAAGKIQIFNFAKFHFSFQRCGSGMFIPDPGSWIPDQIRDPTTTKTTEKERKTNLPSYLFL